ncbi:MAG: hypothetical protein ABI333_19920 [bacterium]
MQPNIIAKADLTGEWYYAPTVVDIGFGSSVTFIGETSMDVAIIKWDIQENVLYARLAYDRIKGTEADHNPLDEVAFAGEPMGAWSISHFDIIRDYNATTGEETNTIRESTERPWYQREFIRVDWSENLVSNWNLMWERTVSMDPLSYFQTDPDHPHSPKLERNADGDLTYIGVTAKVLVRPEMREYGYSGIAELPDCYFYGSTTTCTSTEVVVRHAFARLDPDHEYHPREYTQVEMDDYGYFLSERKTYSRDYGVTVGGITWYANRFNLYKDWYWKATNDAEALLHGGDRETTCPGNAEPCRYVDDNSKVYKMARIAYRSEDLPPGLSSNDAHCYCDTNSTKCDKPCFYVADGSPVYVEDSDGTEKFLRRPMDRTLKPIAYYLNETFPENLMPIMRGVAQQWARQFNMAVWLAAGCSNDDFVAWEGGAPNVCRPEFSTPGFTMLVLCEHAVVEQGDPIECGPIGKTVRIGDIRYSHVVWVDAPQQSSPLGYGPPLANPLTGETISAIANIYGAPIDSYSVYAKDIVRMVTDQNFPWEDYLWGRVQSDAVKRLGKDGTYPPESAGRNKVGQIPDRHRFSWRRRTYTQDDVRRIYRGMDFSWTHAIPTSSPGNEPDQRMPKSKVQEYMNKRIGNIAQSYALGNGTNPQQGRINILRNSYLEDLMMTPDYLLSQARQLMAAGYDPTSVTGADLPFGSAARNKISPLTRLNVKYLRSINQVKYAHHAKTIMYPEFMPFDEPSTVGVAAEVVCTRCCADTDKDPEGNCPDVEQCKMDPLRQTARWTADPNCSDNVKWRVREMIFDGVTIHEMGHNVGLRHNFKGSNDAMNYFDPYWEIRKMNGHLGSRLTGDDERTNQEDLAKVTNYQYSSIMDYGAKFNSDFEGLGRHDTASIMHTYAGFTQVFNQVNDLDKIALLQTFRQFSWPTPVRFWYGILPDGTRGRGPEALQYYTLHYDANVQPDGAVDTREANRSWVPTEWIVEYTDPSVGEVYMTDSAVETKGGGNMRRVMVPYKMCSDEFRNSSLGCNYFDEGPDLFEITENQIQAYENYYLFNNFGRDRYEWGWDDTQYTGRILSRYFDLMQNHAHYYVLYSAIFHDWGIYYPDQIENFLTDPVEGWASFTVAAARTFETFGRVLNQPGPGEFIQRERMDGTPYWFRETEPQYTQAGSCGLNDNTCFQVPMIEGKHWDDTWDFNFGYQWYLRKIRYGHFYDRPLAIQMLGEATNNFMGRDTQEDVRMYTINYMRIWPKQINVLMQAINSQDLSIMAPSYCGKDSEGAAIIEHRNIADLTAPRCALTGGTFDGYVDPGDTFTSQLSATTWGMAMFPMNYSQEFLDNSRIYIQGNGEGIDFNNLPPEAELVTFTDPFSYKTYQAVRYPDVDLAPEGEPPAMYSPAIGATMLDQAQAIKDEYLYWMDQYENVLTPGTPEHVQAYNEMYKFRENLKNYVINLDVTRATTYLFEHPDYSSSGEE